jgi:hypothetical protein
MSLPSSETDLQISYVEMYRISLVSLSARENLKFTTDSEPVTELQIYWVQALQDICGVAIHQVHEKSEGNFWSQ